MANLDWIKQIDETLVALDEKPQFGTPIDFSWEAFENNLREVFENPSLSVTHKIKGWIDFNQVADGLSKKIKIISIFFAPLDHPVYFAISDQDIQLLMVLFLGGEETASFFYESGFLHGFYDYFTAEILRILAYMGLGSPLSPRIGDTFESINEISLNEPCFVMDAHLSSEKLNFWGRIFFPKSFREDWKKYFLHSAPAPLTEEIRSKIQVELALDVGHARLNFSDWQKVNVGDFIILDHCSYNPETGKGGALLALEGKPVFRGRFKEGGIKITNYPAYDEVTTMIEKNLGEDNEDFLEDDELDDDLFNDFPEDEHDLKESAHLDSEEKGTSINVGELPVNLTIEVTRLKMSAQELMNLAPGNLLDLNVAPENGVDLVVNGKKVGRGELLRLGEVLGVRITSL